MPLVMDSFVPLLVGESIAAMVAAIDAENELGRALERGGSERVFMAKLKLNRAVAKLREFSNPLEGWHLLCDAIEREVARTES